MKGGTTVVAGCLTAITLRFLYLLAALTALTGFIINLDSFFSYILKGKILVTSNTICANVEVTHFTARVKVRIVPVNSLGTPIAVESFCCAMVGPRRMLASFAKRVHSFFKKMPFGTHRLIKQTYLANRAILTLEDLAGLIVAAINGTS